MDTMHRAISFLFLCSLAVTYSAGTSIEQEVDFHGLPDCVTVVKTTAPRDSICGSAMPFPWASGCSTESREIIEEWFRETCSEVVPVNFLSLSECARDAIVSGSLQRGCYALSQSCFCDTPESEVLQYVDGVCSDPEYAQAREWYTSMRDCEPESVGSTIALEPITPGSSLLSWVAPKEYPIAIREVKHKHSTLDSQPTPTESILSTWDLANTESLPSTTCTTSSTTIPTITKAIETRSSTSLPSDNESEPCTTTPSTSDIVPTPTIIIKPSVSHPSIEPSYYTIEHPPNTITTTTTETSLSTIKPSPSTVVIINTTTESSLSTIEHSPSTIVIINTFTDTSFSTIEHPPSTIVFTDTTTDTILSTIEHPPNTIVLIDTTTESSFSTVVIVDTTTETSIGTIEHLPSTIIIINSTTESFLSTIVITNTITEASLSTIEPSPSTLVIMTITTESSPTTITESILEPTTVYETLISATTIYATRTITTTAEQSPSTLPSPTDPLPSTSVITTTATTAIYSTRTITVLDQTQTNVPGTVVAPPPSEATGNTAVWSPSDRAYFLRQPMSPGLNFAMTFLLSFGSFFGIITFYEFIS